LVNIANFLAAASLYTAPFLKAYKEGYDSLKRRMDRQGGFTLSKFKAITCGTIADDGEESYELEVRDYAIIVGIELYEAEYAGYANGTVTTSGGVPNTPNVQDGWGIKVEVNDTNVVPGGITLKAGDGASYDWAPLRATMLNTAYMGGVIIKPEDDLVISIINLTGGQKAGNILAVYGYDLNARNLL